MCHFLLILFQKTPKILDFKRQPEIQIVYTCMDAEITVQPAVTVQTDICCAHLQKWLEYRTPSVRAPSSISTPYRIVRPLSARLA